jgi:hypothetical protein
LAVFSAIFPAAGGKVHDSGRLFAGIMIPYDQDIEFAVLISSCGKPSG